MPHCWMSSGAQRRAARPEASSALTPRSERHGRNLPGLPVRYLRTAARGCSSMAEHQLPKLIARVRFPSPAPFHRSLFDFFEQPFYWMPSLAICCSTVPSELVFCLFRGHVGTGQCRVGEPSGVRSFYPNFYPGPGGGPVLAGVPRPSSEKTASQGHARRCIDLA
jgi:hypothetical protein